MAARGKTRQGVSSLGLEDGQGQGGEQEQETRRGTRLTGWTFTSFYSLDFYVLRYFILVWKRPGRQANAKYLVISELEKDQSLIETCR